MPSRSSFARTAALLSLAALPARAVQPGFNVHLSEYPYSPPLGRVVFAVDAGPTPISTLTTTTLP